MKRASWVASGATVVVAACISGLMGVAPAVADTVPSLAPIGSDVVFLPSGNCYGTVHMSLDQVPGDPQAVLMTATSTGTWGREGCPVRLRMENAWPVEQYDLWMSSGQESRVLHPAYGLNMALLSGGQPIPVWGAAVWILRMP